MVRLTQHHVRNCNAQVSRLHRGPEMSGTLMPSGRTPQPGSARLRRMTNLRTARSWTTRLPSARLQSLSNPLPISSCCHNTASNGGVLSYPRAFASRRHAPPFMNRIRFLMLVALCIGSSWVTTLAQAQRSDAERTAQVYMTAFFSGDVKTAADLTDTRTLERIRESFLADLLRADPESEKAILASFGAEVTTAALSQMDAKSLYIALTEADHRKNPQVFEAMKRTQIEFLGSAPNPSGGIIVRFRIKTVGGPASRESGLILRQVQGEWKVVGKAPQ